MINMKHKIFSLFCFIVIFGFNQAKSQSISASKEIYNFFETDEIVINFSEGPGNFYDWIAIYNEGDVPGTDPYLTWLYVDGSQLGFFGQKSCGPHLSELYQFNSEKNPINGAAVILSQSSDLIFEAVKLMSSSSCLFNILTIQASEQKSL